MVDTMQDVARRSPVTGPSRLQGFAHVSLPCRDLAEGKRFYIGALGGEIRVDEPSFAAITVAGVSIGLGTEGCEWLGAGAEYPHVAFFIGAEELVAMKQWLGQCGIPTSNFWTRHGVEALMFFRDPSGNLLELYCRSGFEGAEKLPKGPPRGHGTAVDIDALRYDSWRLAS